MHYPDLLPEEPDSLAVNGPPNPNDISDTRTETDIIKYTSAMKVTLNNYMHVYRDELLPDAYPLRMSLIEAEQRKVAQPTRQSA